eukprot:6473257-Alexandrium_andersonii.AAC.1
MAEDCTDCGLEDCGYGCCDSRFRECGPLRNLISLTRSGSARRMVQCAPGPMQLKLRTLEA